MEDYSCSYIEIHFYTEDGSLHCRLHQGSNQRVKTWRFNRGVRPSG